MQFDQILEANGLKPKKIRTIIYFLTSLYDGIPVFEGGYRQISRELWYDFFAAGYKKVQNILFQEGLIETDGEGFIYKERCYHFRKTEYCNKLLWEYLHSDLLRWVQCPRPEFKSHASRGWAANEARNCATAEFDLPAVLAVLSKMPEDKALANIYHLNSLFRGEDKCIEINKLTGRIFDNLSGLSGSIRSLAKLGNATFALDLDARACHFMLLGDHLLNKNPNDDALRKEVMQWRALFVGIEHPRIILAEKTGLSTSTIKIVMLSWLNGKPNKKFSEYMAKEWPNIYRCLPSDKKARKKVGNEISSGIESHIFRKQWILDLARAKQVRLINMHDGLMIFGRLSDAQSFADEFEAKVGLRLGWAPCFTIKSAQDLVTNPKDEIKKLEQKIQSEHDPAKKRGRQQRLNDYKRRLLSLGWKEPEQRAA